jgi:malate/lactate dehydrogenase
MPLEDVSQWPEGLRRKMERGEGEYGLTDVCLGVPCVVGQGGVRQIVEAPLSPEEKAALLKSASILQGALKELTG